MEAFSPQYVDELGRLSQRALFEYACFVEVLRELPKELSGGINSPLHCWEEADESFRMTVETFTQLEMHPLDVRLREAQQSVKPPGSAYIVRAPRSTSGNDDQQLIRFQSIYCAIEFAMQSLKQRQHQLEHLITQLKPVKDPDEWQALAGQLIEIGSEDLISLSWEHPDFPQSVASYRLEAELTWLAQLANGNSSAVCEVSPDDELIPGHNRGDRSTRETDRPNDDPWSAARMKGDWLALKVMTTQEWNSMLKNNALRIRCAQGSQRLRQFKKSLCDERGFSCPEFA